MIITVRLFAALFVSGVLSVNLFAAPVESIGGDQPARAARSIHLAWESPECDAFYNEMVIEQSTAGSYFMACGWSGGYFGIQELGGGRKIAIFSLWDAGVGDATKSTNAEDRVEVLFKGEGTQVQRFGGEGTGQQCKFEWPWKIGATNRFLVRSFSEAGKTAYAGYIYDSAKSQWLHLATFRRRGGGALRGLYSFLEDFRRDGRSAEEVRKAMFQNGWVKTAKSGWRELNSARFTASNAPTEARDTVNASSGDFGWSLATGGDTRRLAKINSVLTRSKPSGEAPGDLPAYEPGH